MRRGESSHMTHRAVEVAHALAGRRVLRESDRAKLVDTRSEVVREWSRVSELLNEAGESELASRVRQFVGGFPPPRTEKELIAQELRRQLAEQRTR